MEIVRRGNQRNGKNYRDDLIVFYKRAGTDGEPGNIIYGKKVPVKSVPWSISLFLGVGIQGIIFSVFAKDSQTVQDGDGIS